MRLFHYRLTVDELGELGLDTGADAWPFRVARVLWEGDAPSLLDAVTIAAASPDLSEREHEQLRTLREIAEGLAS